MASLPAEKEMGTKNIRQDGIYSHFLFWAKRGQNIFMRISALQYLAEQTISHNNWYKVQRWVVVHGIGLDVEAEQDVGQVTRWSCKQCKGPIELYVIAACEAKRFDDQKTSHPEGHGFWWRKNLDEDSQDIVLTCMKPIY